MNPSVDLKVEDEDDGKSENNEGEDTESIL
jgi:hypothetical protein